MEKTGKTQHKLFFLRPITKYSQVFLFIYFRHVISLRHHACVINLNCLILDVLRKVDRCSEKSLSENGYFPSLAKKDKMAHFQLTV
jgi:hypothetical protein